MRFLNNHRNAYNTVYWFAVGTKNTELCWGDKRWKNQHNAMSDWYRDHIRGAEK